MLSRQLCLCTLVAAALIGCGSDRPAADDAGVIAVAAKDAAAPAVMSGERLAMEALLAGVCQARQSVPNPEQCKGLDEFVACSRRHCPLGECEQICKPFLDCVNAAPDQCRATSMCPADNPCLNCIAMRLVCVWGDHCGGVFSCGTSGPDGACARLEKCCLTQNDPTECNGWLKNQRNLAGDEGCDSLIRDPGFVKAYANDPPCAL